MYIVNRLFEDDGDKLSKNNSYRTDISQTFA